MRQLKVSELILDFNLYPRSQVDGNHVRYMLEAQEAGATFPPIMIDQKSKRIVDGFHRATMFKRIGDDHLVEVVERRYKDEGEMFADAMRLNAHHGRNLTRFDRTHCILRGLELGMDLEVIASALSMTVDSVGELKADRVGEMKVGGKTIEIPLKRTIRHMAGHKMSQRQQEANARLGGMNQLFYVNQILELIDADLIDKENSKLMEGLERLFEALKGVVEKASA